MASGFIYDYFISPLKEGTGYNPVNTTVYALLFVFAVYLIYESFRKLNVKLDRNFLFGWVAWIFVGASFRVLEDVGYYKTPLLKTPFIFIILAIAGFALLIASIRMKMPQLWIYVPAIIALYNLLFIPYTNLLGIYYVGVYFFIITVWLFALHNLGIFSSLLTKTNTVVLKAQMFDAVNTFVAIQYFNAWEQHVLPSFFIQNYGTWTMLPLKFIVIGVVLLGIDKYSENAYEKKYLKLIVATIGLATGLRDFLQILTY